MRKKIMFGVLVGLVLLLAGCWLKWEKFEWRNEAEVIPEGPPEEVVNAEKM